MRTPSWRRIQASVAVLGLVLFGGALAMPAGEAAPLIQAPLTQAPIARARTVHTQTADTTTIRPACGVSAAPLHASCFALLDTSVRQGTDLAKRPRGFGADNLESAYRLPGRGGAGQTIAVVDAYDDPSAETDLAVYRAEYGLPPCTTANGCFSKVNQSGHPRDYPPVDGGWALEISLDLDMVSAACPRCHILLVEGNSSLIDDLGASVDTAVRLGADAVTNSYGLDEFGGMRAYFSHYRHAGVPILASSGDYGFGPAQFPAVVPDVVAVGGTSLYQVDTNKRGWVEQAWSGAGSGCSAYVAKPRYQHDRHCDMRTIADVSADADPNTGVAVYDTTPNPYGITPGWLVVGGTSASSPFIAGVIGQAGNAGTFTTARLYRHAADLYDAVGGTNGFCGGDYLCTGKRGYDGPTGLGTPNGTRAF